MSNISSGIAPGHADDVFNVDVWGVTDIDQPRLEDDNYDGVDHDGADDELVGDDIGAEELDLNGELPLSECVEGVREGYDSVFTSRHLVESQGKIFMVKRKRLVAAFTPTHHTRQVEVFEADIEEGAWVPVDSGVGSGQAIFVSNRSSSVVSASGEVEEGVMYFSDFDDVFDMKSRTIRPATPMNPAYERWMAMWVFPPDLVV
jgi:hypothetical protein